jgi:uncharacterized protein YbjT (DUF2867 family)
MLRGVPVVVTGADEPLGAAVVEALLAAGAPEVRATVSTRAAVRPLVERGVRTAVSDLVDPERLGAVLAGAHTVVHLAGPVPLATLGLVLDAAQDSGLRRLVTVGAGPPAALVVPDGLELVLLDGSDLVAAAVQADRRPAADPGSTAAAAAPAPAPSASASASYPLAERPASSTPCATSDSPA